VPRTRGRPRRHVPPHRLTLARRGWRGPLRRTA
jgi:hypothetical protein